jgi:hypothetical protein
VKVTESSDRPARPDLVEELVRLAAAAQDWIRAALPQGAAASAQAAPPMTVDEPFAGSTAEPAGSKPMGEAAAECQWCPLCRAAHALREESPELTEQLAAWATEAGNAAAAALRTVADVASAWAAGRSSAPPADSGSRVHRIDLDEPRDGT